MNDRFIFSTRDWCWLCLVFALAFGWFAQVRYSIWREENLLANDASIYTKNELSAMFEKTASQLRMLQRDNNATNYAIDHLLGAEEREELEEYREEYLRRSADSQ